MACCGQKRGQISTAGVAAKAKTTAMPVSKFVLYEYTGKTAMVVNAPASGLRYHFASLGAKVQVDLRDVASMEALPNLKRVT